MARLKSARYSRRPLVPAHSPARPFVPFTLPRSLPPQAGRAATDVSLFDPPKRPGPDCRRCASPSSPRSSLSHHAAPSPHGGNLRGTCQEPEHGRTGGRR